MLLLTRTLWRPSAGWILIELPVVSVAATLVVFFCVLPVKSSLDGFLFQARAAYTTVAAVPSPSQGSGVTALVFDAMPVAPIGALHDGILDSPLIGPVQLDVPSDLRQYADRVIGAGNIWSGSATGALLDAETARRFGVQEGDEVIIALNLLYGDAWARVKIGGITAPFVGEPGGGVRGLLVVDPTQLDPQMLAAISEPPVEYGALAHWDEFDGGDAGDTRSSLRDAFLGNLLDRDNILPFIGVVAFAILLWLTVIVRASSQAAQQVSQRAALLGALGGRTDRLPYAIVAPQAIVITVGAIIGTAINAVALYPMILGLIVQPLISLAACLVLIAAGCGYLFVLVRTMHAGLRGSLIVELSAAETQA